MSVAAPPRRRVLERTGMTPEQELELLVREQTADDTFSVRKPAGEIHFSGTVAEQVGVEYDFDSFDAEASGEIVSFLPREEESLFSVGIPHGVRSTYTNLKCRCPLCSAANAKFIRENRAAKRAAA